MTELVGTVNPYDWGPIILVLMGLAIAVFLLAMGWAGIRSNRNSRLQLAAYSNQHIEELRRQNALLERIAIVLETAGMPTSH